ncbi:MAG: hypothetical protein WAT70_02160 [Rhizobiaceae bacterium]
MKWMLTPALALALAGSAMACPMQHQSAEADMTRIVASAAPISVAVDPLPTASVVPAADEATTPARGKRAEE